LRFLYLDLNSFFASVHQQHDPRLRGRPVVVAPVKAEGTCAIAASFEAKICGIKTGTPIWQARQLCPDVAVVLARHELYVTVHHQVLAAVNTVMPISRVCSIDEVLCTLLSSEQSPAAATALAKAMKRALYAHIGPCITASIGVAPSRLLAKIASDRVKPNGLVVFEEATLPAALFPLQLTDLPGIGHAMEKRLWKSGIFSVADLWNLPLSRARAAWGSVEGERFCRQLHGEAIPDQETTRSSISHSHVLPPDLRHGDAPYTVARRLSVKCMTRLRRYHLAAGHLELFVRGQTHQWAATASFPACQDTATVLASLEKIWPRQTHTMPIFKVGVVLSGLSPIASAAQPLFPPEGEETRKRNAKLSFALDALNQRYGRDTVTYADVHQLATNPAIGTKIAFTRVPEHQEFWE
jgi:DNA polymerase IV